MAEHASKKAKTYHKNYKKNKYVLEPGQKGFLATCNFREKDCVRECYNILNEYYTKLYGAKETESDPSDPKTNEDVSEELEKQIQQIVADSHEEKKQFQNVNTGTANCIFIKADIENPVDFGMQIIRDLSNLQLKKSRFLLRLVPILSVCRANIDSIVEAAEHIFKDYFTKGDVSYSIQFNKRYNNVIDRMNVINNLAASINKLNPTNKVNLKNGDLFVIVEVIKGLCLLSVVPDYFKYKKFNLAEICKEIENTVTEAPSNENTVAETKSNENTVSETQSTSECPDA